MIAFQTAKAQISSKLSFPVKSPPQKVIERGSFRRLPKNSQRRDTIASNFAGVGCSVIINN